MKYAQTIAEEIAENCGNIGKYGCLAMCYLYCAGIDENDALEYIRLVSKAVDAGILDKDCTVLDANKFIESITGRKVTVRKKNITDIKDIEEATPVKFTNNGYSHWVVAEHGKIVFNSLANSVCVAKGKPVEARIIHKA